MKKVFWYDFSFLFHLAFIFLLQYKFFSLVQKMIIKFFPRESLTISHIHFPYLNKSIHARFYLTVLQNSNYLTTK